MKKGMKTGCLALVFAMTISAVGGSIPAQAKKKPTLNKKKAVMYEGDKLTLVVLNAKKKTWSTSKKKVATVNKKGVVTAKKKGKAVITVKADKKKLKCKITVKARTAYKTVKIEDFESYAAGTDWNCYTLGEGLTSGGDEKPHYLAKGETMKVVADPENKKNKVLQVKPRFYSYAPVFTVDLSGMEGMEDKKLGDFAGIRVKVRVVSDASCHVGIKLGAFCGAAGSIDKRYAFNTYTTQKQALPAEREFYKFYYAKGMVTGETPDDGTMPAYTASKHDKGHKFAEKDKAVGFAVKTLEFNKYLTSDLKKLSSFDFVVGGSYGTRSDSEYLAWYIDDVELLYK